MADLAKAARTVGLVAASGAAVGAAGLGYALSEANAFVLRRVEVPVLPTGARPIRVLHLSDIHLMPYQHRKLAWLSTLAGLEPDLVVNTGDNISSPAAIEPLLAAWGRLLDAPGVFVFGSNDYTEPVFRNPLVYFTGPSKKTANEKIPLPFEDLRTAMTSRGWIDLNHHRAELMIAGQRLAFRGTDDAHHFRDDYSLVAGPADPDAVLNIGVTHAPYQRILDAMTADGVQLIFAGHTHGGQVCVPLYGALVTNCDIERERVKGLSSHSASGKTAFLHVSGGMGTSPYAPIRFACRPEATLLTLVPR